MLGLVLFPLLIVLVGLGFAYGRTRIVAVIERRRQAVRLEADRLWSKYGSEALLVAQARGARDAFYRAVKRTLDGFELRFSDLNWLESRRASR
jgi:hypothetical protein